MGVLCAVNIFFLMPVLATIPGFQRLLSVLAANNSLDYTDFQGPNVCCLYIYIQLYSRNGTSTKDLIPPPFTTTRRVCVRRLHLH